MDTSSRPASSASSRPVSQHGRIDLSSIDHATGLPAAPATQNAANSELTALFNRLSAFQDESLVLEAEAHIEAFSESSVMQYISEDTVRHVYNCMKDSPDNTGLQRNGCALMANLAAFSEALQTHVVECGALPLVFKVLTVHQKDPKTLYRALDVIASLASSNAQARERIGDAENVACILSCLADHATDVDVQFGAVCALAGTAMLSPISVATIVRLKGMEALVQCYKNALLRKAADTERADEWAQVLDWAKLALRNIARCVPLVGVDSFSDEVFGRFGESVKVDELKYVILTPNDVRNIRSSR